MTLDEAITHAEEQAAKLKDCLCGTEHKQLAEWLKELQERRKADGNEYAMQLIREQWEDD